MKGLKSELEILQPVVALVLWSFFMMAWMYATRIPAIIGLKIKYDPEKDLPAKMHAQIPGRVRWKADNYNHLMEQPTLFYAICGTLAILGEGSGLNATLAWLYFISRVIHSLIQAQVNIIMLRFSVFMISSTILFFLTVRTALIVF